MFWGIDIRTGTVEYDDISYLSEDSRICDHLDYLKEDMLQISFPKGFIIDVGWRPSFSENGKFFIVAVRDGDWDRPIVQAEASDVLGVKNAIKNALKAVI